MGVKWTFWGLLLLLGHLAFVVVVVGTYSPFNINCPLSKNEFLVSNDLGMLSGGRQFPSAPLLCGFHLRSQD